MTAQASEQHKVAPGEAVGEPVKLDRSSLAPKVRYRVAPGEAVGEPGVETTTHTAPAGAEEKVRSKK